MLNCTYFAKQLTSDVRGMRQSVTAILSLHGGEEYHVLRVARAEESYVALWVFPAASAPTALREDWWDAMERGEPIADVDLLAVPYSSINHMRLTPGPATGTSKTGVSWAGS